MTAILPSRGAARLMALERANTVKVVKTRWRKRVRSANRADGLSLVADLLEDPPDLMASTMVWELVGWVSRLSDQRQECLLAAAQVGQFRQLGELTVRQRSVLAAVLRSAR